jgi:hypothetical protein
MDSGAQSASAVADRQLGTVTTEYVLAKCLASDSAESLLKGLSDRVNCTENCLSDMITGYSEPLATRVTRVH